MSKFINKIQRYNQVILAVLGTIGIIILLLSAIMLLTEIIRSWSYNNDYQDEGILATEEIIELNKDSLRKQVISFSMIEVIDSANQIFVIPVTQANLDNEEKYDNGSYNKFSPSKRSIAYYNKAYNNLVIYNAVSKSSEIIFDNRLSISDYFLYTFEGSKYIIITASIYDTNKDGLLNSDDFQQLYIYDLSKKKIFEMDAGKNYTTIKAFSPNKSTQLLAHFGIDRNNDNRFDPSTEPKIFYTINLNTMTIQELVNSDQLNTLQKRLEGR